MQHAIQDRRRSGHIDALLTQGLIISAIARHLHLDRKTVRRVTYAMRATDLLDAASQRPRELDPFLTYLARRWREGCQVATSLHREPHERGYRLRYPGVTFRRFAEPEPTVALGVVYRQTPSLAARRLIDLAQELGRQGRLAGRPHL